MTGIIMSSMNPGAAVPPADSSLAVRWRRSPPDSRILQRRFERQHDERLVVAHQDGAKFVVSLTQPNAGEQIDTSPGPIGHRVAASERPHGTFNAS
jgi:hypothetical protein